MPDERGPTIVSVLTPPGRGAIAVVAIRGPRALACAEQFFQPRGSPALSQRPLNNIVYGRWGAEPAEDVIVCRGASDQIEIHCHGGAAASQRIIDDLSSAGVINVHWSEFHKQCEPSPTRAAAHLALASCITQRTASILLDQYHGALERELRQIIEQIDRLDLLAALAAIQQLLSLAPLGLHLTTPWRVVIAGPPNVGKSSLLNALLGYARAIVYHEPGTTRDAVTATTALDGWPVQLVDTAGWRESNDPIEMAGVRLAEKEARAADCLLLVFDSAEQWIAANNELLAKWRPAIIVANKSDLPPIWKRADVLATNTLTGDGIEELAEAVAASLVPRPPSAGQSVPFTQPQFDGLAAAASELHRNDVNGARDALLALCKP